MTPKAGHLNIWEEYQKWKADNKDAVAAALKGGLVGSPDTIRRKLRKFAISNVDQIILLNQAGNNTHEHICESLELFAKEVMPEFHAMEPAHQDWKRKVMAGEIDLEEIDTTPYRERFGKKLAAIKPTGKVDAAE